MSRPKSWQVAVTCSVTAPNQVVLAPGTYTLLEVSDISYAIHDANRELALLLVSDVARSLASGASSSMRDGLYVEEAASC